MKKLTSLMMAAALAVSITACGATANTNAAASSATNKSTATGEAGNETVTITYPEYMIPGVMSDGTDEERMKAAKEFCKVLLDKEGVLEAKPSADGSVIATMTREAHKSRSTTSKHPSTRHLTITSTMAMNRISATIPTMMT